MKIECNAVALGWGATSWRVAIGPLEGDIGRLVLVLID
jgi:hypothetical protein